MFGGMRRVKSKMEEANKATSQLRYMLLYEVSSSRSSEGRALFWSELNFKLVGEDGMGGMCLCLTSHWETAHCAVFGPRPFPVFQCLPCHLPRTMPKAAYGRA